MEKFTLKIHHLYSYVCQGVKYKHLPHYQRIQKKTPAQLKMKKADEISTSAKLDHLHFTLLKNCLIINIRWIYRKEG